MLLNFLEISTEGGGLRGKAHYNLCMSHEPITDFDVDNGIKPKLSLVLVSPILLWSVVVMCYFTRNILKLVRTHRLYIFKRTVSIRIEQVIFKLGRVLHGRVQDTLQGERMWKLIFCGFLYLIVITIIMRKNYGKKLCTYIYNPKI